ncbi:histidine kinase [Sphingopyxis sp. BSNA05]|uniref:ATP-binding protein n=1 Tax=Sphingopyxis sp. BSNA05 TaxID=1236614 RepID=UPI001566BE38|nr:ATP-binding protein [Sphingopyxis sp. BSNA05]NRD89244.1 histidine kinase [Sphingopyxis sp. BSNA05]
MSDYDLEMSVCELIDNSIDIWNNRGKKGKPIIDVHFNIEQQIISIVDNCGGIKESQLDSLLAPGASQNSPDDEIIGIFGVGSKRAVVALGNDIEIRSRFGSKETFSIKIDNEWLGDDRWEIPYYKVNEINKGTTEIRIHSLRFGISDGTIHSLRERLGYTYCQFIKMGCQIRINGQRLVASHFEHWAFPSGNPPRQSLFSHQIDGLGEVNFDISAGLILDRDPETENYGAYFYCNDRLICRDVKDRRVGYNVPGELGVPHPDASLCRAVIRINGPAKLMPWNSSKTDVNFDHSTIGYFRPTMMELLKHYSSLSRRLKKDWDRQVFCKTEGDVEIYDNADPEKAKTVHLPTLPRVRQSTEEKILNKNKNKIAKNPYLRGIIEGIVAADLVQKTKISAHPTVYR